MDYDFSFFLVIASLVTGIIWGGYLLFLKLSKIDPTSQKEPLLVEYAHSFFPIVFIVLILRSFIAEPFRIPSGSMMPTLLIGDFILVNKFTYGIRLPVLNNKIIEINKPERGDIVVFRFPQKPEVDYIKRVVGVPGDRVAYYQKKILINGQPAKQVSLGAYQAIGEGMNMMGAEHISENLSTVEHSILIRKGVPSVEGIFVVPEGHYFVMGDNRDNSNDSRYWGTVPEENLVGKAFLIWMSWDWEHKGIGFDRIGTILK
ncbi:MAG: signal peptidase I [Methylococcaceae bacterium]|nr:signal peptidase I [Methylococcaceae bacterium]